jgi:hypothetical protein
MQSSQHQQAAEGASSSDSAVIGVQTASLSTVAQGRGARRPAASTQPAPRRSARAPFSSRNTRKTKNADRALKKSGNGKGSSSAVHGPCEKENVPPAGCGFCSGGAGCWRCTGMDAVAGTSAGGGPGLASLGAFGAFGASSPPQPPPSGSPAMLAGLLTAERTSASSIWPPTFPTLPTGGTFGQRDRLPSRGSIPAPGVNSEDDAAEAEGRRESRGKRQREAEEEEGEGSEERKRARRG